MKKAIIFVGANGSGKSTLARTILSEEELIHHIDPDEFGKSKYGLNKEIERVAKETTELIYTYMWQSKSFSFETVASSPIKLKLIKELKENGYYITVHYCQLANDSESIAGVTRRVRLGGHDVPIEKLISRFPKMQENVEIIHSIADEFHVWFYGTYSHSWTKELKS